MNKYNDLRSKTFQATKELNKGVNELNTVQEKTVKLIKITENIDTTLNSIEKDFLAYTKLSKKDISFLFLCVALQVIRQYYITPFMDRLPHDKVAENTFGKTKEHSDRRHQLYNPSLDQIIKNPVPYDAIMGSTNFNLNIGGGFNHRAKTLGHDAVLGWIFGTMNIATSTITLNDFSSYHVKTKQTISGNSRDAISLNANLYNIISSCLDKMFNQGLNGKKKIAASLLKQGIHSASDIPSKASLPIPIISVIDINLVNELANYGVDMANVLHVGKQAIYADMINYLISMLHRICYSNVEDGSIETYKIKTSKLITYSNIISSSSNIIYVSISSLFGNVNSIKTLDVGGFIVAIGKILNDRNLQIQLEEEFMTQQLSKIILSV